MRFSKGSETNNINVKASTNYKAAVKVVLLVLSITCDVHMQSFQATCSLRCPQGLFPKGPGKPNKIGISFGMERMSERT